MRKLGISTLVSLDGVMQDPGGFGETKQGGWSAPFFDEEAQQYALDHLLTNDLFLCGRVTYELLSKFWSQVHEGKYAERINHMPKLVASSTLKEPLEWNAGLITGDVAEEVANLKRQPGQDIVMYGSTGLMHTLMQHALIDEYRIWVHPLVLGKGKRLFDNESDSTALTLVDTRALSSGIMILTYKPAGRRGDAG